jgi:PDZ domain-containing protein
MVDEAVAAPRGAGRVRRRTVLLVPLLLLVIGTVGFGTVRLPYYAMAPGRAIAVDPLVEVDPARRYPAEGQVYLTTVSLRQVTAFGAIRGWLDPTIDVLPEDEVIPPDVSADDYQEHNVALMAASQQTAELVALQRLGYDVTATGTGALVAQVVDGSPADGVLRLADVIVAVGATPVSLSGDAVAALGRYEPGDRVELRVRRAGGAEEVVEVTLGARDGDDSAPFLGVALQTADLRYDLPFDVAIDANRIVGPSAGLAFTLELLDVLSPGELMGGRRVAATGTISPDGAVGAVGGIPQKTAAVERAGVELFLVPEGALGAARGVAGDGLRVEEVATIDEALTALAEFGGEALLAAPAPASAG